MLDFAIRKSENALERVLFTLVLSSVAMLGLVWLSIAIAGWLALVVPPPTAAAITGGIFFAISLLAYVIGRAVRHRPKAKTEGLGAQSKTEDVTSRAIRIAERMAPDTPVIATLVALLAGLGSVSLPAALNPFLNKILDDVEKAPEAHTRN